MKGTGDEVLWINDSFGLNDAGHIIMTSYVDLRNPEDRTPIKSLVRACERQYALEDCENIIVSTPSRFRSFGEGLILDPHEGFAKEEEVTERRKTSTNTSRERSVSDLNEALKLLDTNIRLSHTESYKHTETETERKSGTLTYAKEWWIFCTSIRPDENEWESWCRTLPGHYDHVSEIGQPAKFAQALAHMTAEQLGPHGKKGRYSSKVGNAETEWTNYPTQWVLHGPVVYTDSVYHALAGITDDTARMAASIFTKGREHTQQREYRFAIISDGAEEESVFLRISGMMKDALKLTNHGLVRAAGTPPSNDPDPEIQSTQPSREQQAAASLKMTRSRRTGERKEWRMESKNSDGEILSSESGLEESFTELTISDSNGSEEINLQPWTQMPQDQIEPEETPTGSDTTDDMESDLTDRSAVRELALDEFDWDDDEPREAIQAIPVRTVTGRVYGSFEEMMRDPSYPQRPFNKIWEEDANTSQEVTATYRAVDVLNMKMGYVGEEFRQDIASAGWYAMLCIRNIYSRLGDIVETLSIVNNRFIVIRLRNSEELEARGRIVVSPSGAYAYSFQLPKEENIGHGGLEWGTAFFPIGTTVDTFDRYGWPKKIT